MPELKWTLFHDLFMEEITPGNETEQKKEQEREQKQKLEQEKEEDDDESYELSDVIRDVYYVTTLKKINEPQYANQYSEYLKSLNAFDDSFGSFLDTWKGHLKDLEMHYAEIEPDVNQRLGAEAGLFAEDLLKCLRKDGGQAKDFESQLENINTLLEDQTQQEFQVFSDKITRLLKEYQKALDKPNNDSDQEKSAAIQRRCKSRIYAQLRRLPQYLGKPYSQRYDLYKQLVSYRRFSELKKSPTVVTMLLQSDSFSAYYTDRVQKIADRVSETQKLMCTDQLSPDSFHQRTMDLQKILETDPKTKKDFLGSGGGSSGNGGGSSGNSGKKGKKCFALIDLHNKKGKVLHYCCFSGTWDYKDTFIKKKQIWTQFPQFDDTLKRLVRAYANSIHEPVTRIHTNRRVRYYSALNQPITIKQMINQLASGHNKTKRMFSCCEVKFLSELEKFLSANVKRYEMYIKFTPCELCRCALDSFTASGYPAPIENWGIDKDPAVKHKAKFDKLAGEIGSGKTNICF